MNKLNITSETAQSSQPSFPVWRRVKPFLKLFTLPDLEAFLQRNEFEVYFDGKSLSELPDFEFVKGDVDLVRVTPSQIQSTNENECYPDHLVLQKALELGCIECSLDVLVRILVQLRFDSEADGILFITKNWMGNIHWYKGKRCITAHAFSETRPCVWGLGPNAPCIFVAPQVA
jgi:hypothetical protein